MNRTLACVAALSLAGCPVPVPAPAPCPDAGGPLDLVDAGPLDGGPSDAGSPPIGLPQIPKNLGHVMNPLTIVTIVAANETQAGALEAFAEAIPESGWWAALSGEYGLGAPAVQHWTGPTLSGALGSADLTALVQNAIAAGAPAPTGNTLYLAFLPQGVTLAGTTDCGYHQPYPDAFSTTGDVAAVIQRCSPFGSDSELDAMTQIASHEIAEGATDPNDRSYNLGTTPPLPWTRSVFRSYAPSGHVEVGDLCEGTRLREGDGGYSYQRIWSNAAAADGGDPCVPALPIAYYGLSGEQEWYAGSPGTPLSIPLAGWSSAPTADWLVNPHWVNWTGGFAKLTPSDVSLTTSLGVPVIGSCNDPHPAMNVGASATLRVTVPPTAASGDYVVFSVHSFRWDPTSCNQPDGEDADHQLLVGVYVP